MSKYALAVFGGVASSFVFTEVIPLIFLGEGAVEGRLATAAVLGVAVLVPGLLVGWVILRRWPETLIVAVVTGVVVFAVHMLDLIERPMGQPLYWPTLLAPAAALVASVVLRLTRPSRGERQPT